MTDKKTIATSDSLDLIDVEIIRGSLVNMEPNEFLKIIATVVRERVAEELSILVSGMEIMQTPTSFTEDNPQLGILRRALSLNPLSFYLEQMGIDVKEAQRSHIMDWWDTLMQIAASLGYNPGGIDNTSRDTNLWKATAPLAAKMQSKAAAYRFLPAVPINHPSEVERVLNEINEPEPFLEVLVGESYQDMLNFPELIGALSTIVRDGEISRTPQDGILSIHLILQRG